MPNLDFNYVSNTSPEPTHRHWVRGKVEKYKRGFPINVLALSLFDNAVLGSTSSDPDTGYYEIDVYPYQEEVIVVAAMDLGTTFEPSLVIPYAEFIVHPTTPNGCVYKASTYGQCGDTEPAWPTIGEVQSGSVTFTAQTLFRPLAGGYLKPTIEAK